MGEFDVTGVGGLVVRLVVVTEVLLGWMDGGVVRGMGVGVDGTLVAVFGGKGFA